ncbi:BrnA antitoxin family protein [Methylococcus sp. Mc7]|uniref:BrnA antitoxin family protein n=1 Tax=Methylococcus sp. Mc7 TaxID=2860258 RepID=UPI001C52D8B7|nr:BrnA antitoxin family protein [Methylococcus sp. Mc7]
MSDPDAAPLTDEEWEAVKPPVRRGKPPAAAPKERITIRLSRDVVDRFKTTGPGWQTRTDAALAEWLKEHRPE